MVRLADLPAADREHMLRKVPALRDFPDNAPYTDLGETDQSLVCPVSLPRSRKKGSLLELRARLAGHEDIALKALAASSLVPRTVDQALKARTGNTDETRPPV